MLASEVVVLATALVTCVTTIAASSCCAYICSRNHRYTVEVLKGKKRELRNQIDELKRKDASKEIAGFITKAEAYLLKEVNNESIRKVEEGINGKCMSDLLPNFWAQKQARNCMEKMFRKLDDLIEKGDELLRKPVKGLKRREVAIVGKKRREEAEIIWNQLVSGAEHSPGTIYIHGVLGVGKTAVATHIYNKAVEDDSSPFDKAIWVEVECGAGLWQVQEKIASRLDSDNSNGDSVTAALRTAGNETDKRAETVKNALLQKGRFLLVLDSMWQPDLSPDDIGIPELVGGRKLIVTSRIRGVSDRIVASKEMFEVQPLSSVEEAWELFKNEMGPLPQNLEEVIASDIKGVLLSELDGLPLAINKLARLLRHKHVQDWDPDDLERVWRKELPTLVKKQINYMQRRDPELLQLFNDSVKHLEGATKSCFMYCALFPKNYIIESKELKEYWMWEGLLGHNFKTLADGMDKGTETINELKNAHLLQTQSGGERVKMLNFLRSMAIEVEGKLLRSNSLFQILKKMELT